MPVPTDLSALLRGLLTDHIEDRRTRREHTFGIDIKVTHG
jgi:hypothetical protein